MTSRSGENVTADAVANQPVAYPRVSQHQLQQTDYYSSTQASVPVGGDVVPPVPPPVPPVVPSVTPVVVPTVVPQSAIQACCPTGWMGTHTHEQSVDMATPRSMSTTTEMLSGGETVTVLGESGVLVNRSEISSFTGPVPLAEYPVNQDTNPEVVRKPADPPVVDYVQEVSFRYLRPPTPSPPGDIVIRQEAPFVPPSGPPIYIRQIPPRPTTPPVLVLREKPPKPVVRIPTKVVVVPSRRVPPPPRKVIIEKIARLPEKPQPIMVERWLGYPQQRRRVVFERHVEPESYYEKTRNTIIEWESPQVRVTRKFVHLDVVRANPTEYVANYSTSLRDVNQMPEFVRAVRPPEGVFLATDFNMQYQVPELEGDLFALSFIDLEREGLGEYRGYLDRVGYGKGFGGESFKGESFLGRRLDEMSAQTVQTHQVEKRTQQMSSMHPTEVPTTTTVMETKAPETQVVREEAVECGGSVSGGGGGGVGVVVPGDGDKARREEVQSALKQVFERFQPRTHNRVSFVEAKEIIRLLNEKLSRSFDDAQCEKFLESMYFKRDDFMTVDAFTVLLLDNI